MKRVRSAAAALVLALCAGGCATVAARPGEGIAGLVAGDAPLDPPPGTSPETVAALRVWRDFPVDAALRPIVLSGAQAHGGEALTHEDRLSFTDPTDLPTGPAEADGYPVINAKDALAIIHREAGGFRRGDPRQRVAVDSVTFGHGAFWTDRGLQHLPAWVVKHHLDVPDRGPRAGTTYVLAVAPAARYGPINRDDAGLRVSADRRTLLVPRSLRGNAEGPCRTVFATSVVETRGAVSYDVEEQFADPDAPCLETPRTWGEKTRRSFAEVRLARPLGNRVVVGGGHGSYAYPAVACGAPSWWVDLPLCEEPPLTLFDPTGPIARQTLEHWSRFDAGADPRPIVLTGDGLLDPQFTSSVDERAWRARRWEIPVDLPAAPAEAGGYPVIGAAQALLDMRGGKALSDKPGHRTKVTKMRLATAAFDTDRGPRVLPAWLVSFTGTDSPGVVPAVAEPARFRYPFKTGYLPGLEMIRIGTDDRTLTLLFRHGRWTEGPCDREFELGRAETAQVVALEFVQLRRRSGTDSDPTTKCVQEKYNYMSFTIKLLAPLGGRAIVEDVTGAAWAPVRGDGDPFAKR
jgi:hypothetical protein